MSKPPESERMLAFLYIIANDKPEPWSVMAMNCVMKFDQEVFDKLAKQFDFKK